MSLCVRIIDVVTNDLVREFSSVSFAIQFVADVAKEKLGKEYRSKTYLRQLIGQEKSCGVLKVLGFKTECYYTCEICGGVKSGRCAFGHRICARIVQNMRNKRSMRTNIAYEKPLKITTNFKVHFTT